MAVRVPIPSASKCDNIVHAHDLRSHPATKQQYAIQKYCLVSKTVYSPGMGCVSCVARGAGDASAARSLVSSAVSGFESRLVFRHRMRMRIAP